MRLSYCCFSVLPVIVVIVAVIIFCDLDVSSSPFIVHHPEWYHGDGRRGDSAYFEGWYFKLTSPDNQRLALIPGFFHTADNTNSKDYAFMLAVADGIGNFYRRDTSKFKFSSNASNIANNFVINWENSLFSLEGIQLHVTPEESDDASVTMDGMLKFDMSSHSYWPMTLFNPGAMGYLSYLSLLTECNHGVLSMDFRITSGSVKINDRIVDFSGGRGYIEKDWGLNFPQSWIWTQAHFGNSSSLFLSIAGVPLMGFTLPGFICGFLHEGILYRFTTYNFADLRIHNLNSTNALVQITSGTTNVNISLVRSQPPKDINKTSAEYSAFSQNQHTLLYGPSSKTKSMERYVVETLSTSAEVTVTFQWKDTASVTRLFQETSRSPGLEMMGDLVALKALFS